MFYALHGFSESDLSWREALAGVPAIKALHCPILPGHGHSPCPDDMDIPRCAAAIAESIEEPVDLLGYSMGGRIALRLALDHGEKVKRLILVSCTAGLRDPAEREERHKRDEALAEILEEDGIGTFVAWWENHPVLRPARPLPSKQSETLRSRRLNNDPRGLAAAMRCFGQGSMANLWGRLPELRMPVLLVSGSTDQTYANIMNEMDELIPHARRRVIPVCGHAPHREQGDALREYLDDFLAA